MFPHVFVMRAEFRTLFCVVRASNIVFQSLYCLISREEWTILCVIICDL